MNHRPSPRTHCFGKTVGRRCSAAVLPSRKNIAPRIRVIQAAVPRLVVMGVLGLLRHCASVLFRPVSPVLHTAGAISQINAMGAVSTVWYAVGALLILLAASLLAVGIALYRRHRVACPFGCHPYRWRDDRRYGHPAQRTALAPRRSPNLAATR